MQTLERDKIAEALRVAYRHRPSGGTEREQRAWRNGFREAVETLEANVEGAGMMPWLARAHEREEAPV